MKTMMVLFLVAVLVALASAGVFMMRRGDDKAADSDRSKHMARALAVRVGLSVALFLLILLSWAMGWVQPTGLPTGR
ncbi:hypothetical protein IP87_15135 [beta proteobacterium AAP121]|nr:hypothetical protein IP80_16520 [beta proteobacterium AAP65]KPF96017.1 hypothetical protein IP87_15135 [beta proteobacterium AAP121]